MKGSIDLGNARQNGAWLVGEADLDTLDVAAHQNGLLVRRISLAGCHDKRDMLQRVAKALAFPESFGNNWDALADCLGDLEWLPQADGYAWLLDHATEMRDVAERDFDTLCDVLEDACMRWKARGQPCFAFLALSDAAFAARGS